MHTEIIKQSTQLSCIRSLIDDFKSCFHPSSKSARLAASILVAEHNKEIIERLTALGLITSSSKVKAIRAALQANPVKTLPKTFTDALRRSTER